MPTKNEKGGALLELTILVFLLAIFCVGAVEVHRACGRRFARVVQHRNDRIQELRR